MLRRILNSLLSTVGLQVVPSFSGLLHAKDDVERRIYSLCHEADERGLDTLSGAQRAVVLAWGATGIIGNGGFKYFYEREWRAAELAAAYLTLGFPDAAQACESSLSVFPDHRPPEDPERRQEYLDSAALALFEELEDPIYEIDWERLKAAIASHLERFPSEQ